ncbi:MAG: gamma-glutamyl-gamma-aminobutyrate hydrolase family protein [Candidatus Eiseniibacteriota bacterium]|jgi:putative glutamine amidotransferase
MTRSAPDRDRPPVIGVSACFFHPDPTRQLFKGKTLLYAEESLLAWLMRGGALPFLLPRATPEVPVAALVAAIDGLVLAGGDDVAPQSYGEEPLRPEWAGDLPRDRYEIELSHECLRADRPVLGVCRGVQLLNVALGGTLWQDISTQCSGALVHRDWEIYDRNLHEVTIEEGSHLHAVLGCSSVRMVSIHHQALRKLGQDLIVEARSTEDGIIEAVRLDSDRYAVGVQWHPEFQQDGDDGVAAAERLLGGFLDAVCERRRQRER